MSYEPEEANAEFMAHARQDVPDLIAEVDRLRAALAAAKDDAPGHCENCRAAVPLTTVHLCATCLPAAPSEHRAELAEAGRSSLHDGWQPIETAPERRKVMVTWVNALGKRRTTFASFWPIGTLDMGDGTPEDHVDEDGKNVFAGWYEESEANEDDFWRLTEMLTHWQLPPAPPASLPLRAGEPQ